MASPKRPIPPRPVQSRNTSGVAKQQADQQAAQAALDARNRAIQRPVNTRPPPNLANLRSVAPNMVAQIEQAKRAELAKQAAAKQAAAQAAVQPRPMPQPSVQPPQQDSYKAYMDDFMRKSQANSMNPNAPQISPMDPEGFRQRFPNGYTPMQPPMPPRPIVDPMPPMPPQPVQSPIGIPQYASPGVAYTGPITPNMVGFAQPGLPPEELYKQYVASYDPGVDQYGMPYDVPSFDQFNFQRNQAQQRDQALLGQMQGVPGFAQPYAQGLASVPQSLEQQQALQQAQLAQVQALPEQQRAMFAEQFQRSQQLNNAMQGVPDFAQPYMQGLQQIPSEQFQQPQGQPGFNSYGFDPALVDYLNNQKQMSIYDAGVSYKYDPATQTFTGNTLGGPVTKTLQEMQAQQQAQVQPPGFAQPYMQGLGAAAAQGLGAAAASRTGGMFQQPKGAAPRSNPMTGLGAFSANPSIAAANPFAGLGVTAGAQQARQTVQPPYNPQMDDFKGSGSPSVPFGQAIGQMFGALGQPMMGQPQTQQSPYAQQQGSNLLQNAGQVGQGVYGSFVGQQQQPQPAMQQQTPQQQQNPAQAMQGSVAPPMQAGFNFFDQGPTQSQSQGNTGGGGLF